MNKTNPQIKKHIIEVVNNQLRDNDPPETNETLQRLISEGIPEKEAIELIGSVVCYEIFHVLKSNKPFNETRYVSALKKLPSLPEE